MSCPFCYNDELKIYLENDLAYIKLDGYPVSPGHLLVIPKRHYGNFFDSTLDEVEALMHLVNRSHDMMKQNLKFDGVNIGINIGEAAGQTVNHVHIHVIPRFKGDVEDPRGGVRWVIPKKANYLK